MIGPISPGAPFDCFVDSFAPGLAADVTVSIYDVDDNLIFGPSNTGVTEIAPIGDLARYGVSLIAPTDANTYLIVWDDNQPDPSSASEDLLVSAQSSGGGGSISWIDGADVAECCDVDIGSSDIDLLDDAAEAASEILYLLGGRQHSGIQGPVTVRPYGTCSHADRWWLQNWGAWNLGVGAGWWSGLRGCRCAGPPTVTLAGYPVREIIAVKIDGAFVAASEYRLDHSADLVRMRDLAAPNRRRPWPARQILDLPDTEPNTWSVTYMYGANVPQAGLDAAAELACEIYKACAGDDSCRLPRNVVRVVRQGITQDRAVLAASIKQGLVGLPQCDLYVGAYNPAGVTQRAAVWSPDVDPYPYRPGS